MLPGALPYPPGLSFWGECLFSTVSHKFGGRECDAFTLQFLITKWQGAIYAPLLPRSLWECFSFSPPVGDGWLQLSTNNHSRSIWLNSLCLDLGNKLVSWKWSCFMRAAFVCLVAVSVVVCCSHEKRIFTQQIHVVEFLHGDFLSLIVQRNSAVLWHVSKVIYNVCWTRCSAVSQSRWASDPSVRGSWVRQWRDPEEQDSQDDARFHFISSQFCWVLTGILYDGC